MIYKRERFVDESFDEEAGNVLSKNIERLTPVNEEGEKLEDESNQFYGIAEVMFEKGPFQHNTTIQFEIPAKTLDKAFSRFDRFAEEEAEKAKDQFEEQVQKEIERVRQERQQQQSGDGIVQPGNISPEQLQKIRGGVDNR